jgi:hypothetical protein
VACVCGVCDAVARFFQAGGISFLTATPRGLVITVNRNLRFLIGSVVGVGFLLAVYAASTRPHSDDNVSSSKDGSIISGNRYTNPALKLQITLPGKWHLKPASSEKPATGEPTSPSSGCRGPLCGPPAINISLEPDSDPSQAIFLLAFKLSSEYRDRTRYPLKRFAETMTLGSLEGSNWVPVGSLDAVQLSGKSAYRLLVQDSKIPGKRGFAYVSESNGHVFLLVGADASPGQNLQQVVEKLIIEGD